MGTLTKAFATKFANAFAVPTPTAEPEPAAERALDRYRRILQEQSPQLAEAQQKRQHRRGRILQNVAAENQGRELDTTNMETAAKLNQLLDLLEQNDKLKSELMAAQEKTRQNYQTRYTKVYKKLASVGAHGEREPAIEMSPEMLAAEDAIVNSLWTSQQDIGGACLRLCGHQPETVLQHIFAMRKHPPVLRLPNNQLAPPWVR